MERMKERISPIFADITWGAGGTTADLTIDIAIQMKELYGLLVNMHMTCTNLAPKDDVTDPKAMIYQSLQTAINQHGMTNIVALRGDAPVGQENWVAAEGGFTCALDLVQFIREKKEFDHVGISVAGYPEGHPNVIKLVEGDISTLSESEKKRMSTFDQGKTYYVCYDEDYQKELIYLKQKVDAGGEFIITQMLFDSDIYHIFVKDCRNIGITVPIVPGIMCINNYPGFMRMTQFCKSRVPDHVYQKLEEIQNDTKAIKAYAIEYGKQLCEGLLIGPEPAPVLHFYTLNFENVTYGILEQLNMIEPIP
jgi:methylenetetrahydrofolate reductase (NADPH)